MRTPRIIIGDVEIDGDGPVYYELPRKHSGGGHRCGGVARPFMAYVVTDRDDPYVNGGRVLRVYAEEADAWDFVAERTALRAAERWAQPAWRDGMTRDQVMEAESRAFQVWSGGIAYPRTSSEDALEIGA